MVTTIPITKARINLGSVVKRVRVNKEYFILEKDGIPVAGLMDIDEFEDYLEMQDKGVRRDIKKSTAEFKSGKARSADSLIGELAGDKKKSPRPKTRPRK